MTKSKKVTTVDDLLPVIDFFSFESFFDEVEIIEKDPSDRSKMNGKHSIFAVLEIKTQEWTS